jgi:hypothetical protein
LQVSLTFRSIIKVTVGNGSSTSFWFDCWIGNIPLSERFPAFFSHSVRKNVCVSSILSSGIQNNLGPRLSSACHGRPPYVIHLSYEFGSVVLHSDEPDQRVSHLFNIMFSNKCFYVNSFKHLHVDVLAEKVRRNVYPLEFKISS